MSTTGKTYGTVSPDQRKTMTGLEFVQGLVDGVRLLSGSLGRSGRHRAILVSELESGLEAGQ